MANETEVASNLRPGDEGDQGIIYILRANIEEYIVAEDTRLLPKHTHPTATYLGLKATKIKVIIKENKMKLFVQFRFANRNKIFDWPDTETPISSPLRSAFAVLKGLGVLLGICHRHSSELSVHIANNSQIEDSIAVSKVEMVDVQAPQDFTGREQGVYLALFKWDELWRDTTTVFVDSMYCPNIHNKYSPYILIRVGFWHFSFTDTDTENPLKIYLHFPVEWNAATSRMERNMFRKMKTDICGIENHTWMNEFDKDIWDKNVDRTVSFMMCTHARLGVHSLLNLLEEKLLRMLGTKLLHEGTLRPVNILRGLL